MKKQIFRSCACILFSLFIFSCNSAGQVTGLASAKSASTLVVPDKDLVYLGAFRVPHDSGSQPGSWLGYAAYGLAFNPAGNSGAGSLFAVGPDNNRYSYVAEFSIPTPVVASIPDKLKSAVLLQSFADIAGGLEGALDNSQLYQHVYGLTYLPPFGSQASGKLYWTSIYDYQPHISDLDIDTLGRSDPALGSPNAAGRWHLSGVPSSHSSKWLFNVPATWADSFVSGQYLAMGRHNVGATGQEAGYGPSLYTVAPWAQGNPPPAGAALARTELLRYPHDHPVERNNARGDWTGGGAWVTIGSKSALIFSYSKGMRSSPNQPPNAGGGDYPWEDYKSRSCLAGGNFCWPESDTYGCTVSDLKSEPYISQLKFFDSSDLALVALKKKLPYEVHPYANYQIERYLFRKQGAVGNDAGCRYQILGGITYDSVHQRIYLEEVRADGPFPIIHVFQLQNNGTSLGCLPPSVPSDIQNVGPAVSWRASKDANGNSNNMVYMVFKWFPAFTSPDVNHYSYPAMWRPVASTTRLTWNDPGYAPGDRYNVTAYDALMQPSNLLNSP